MASFIIIIHFVCLFLEAISSVVLIIRCVAIERHQKLHLTVHSIIQHLVDMKRIRNNIKIIFDKHFDCEVDCYSMHTLFRVVFGLFPDIFIF